MRAVLTLTLLLLTACGGGPDSDSSDPNYQPTQPSAGLDGERNFARLIKDHSRGRVSRMPWAGYWWPYLSDGIAHATSRYTDARGGSQAVSWELSHHGSGVPSVDDWWGHCNGWAAAAVLSSEPREAQSAGGVTFSIGEQKALLSELGMEVEATFFGLRDNTEDTSSHRFQDVYPNQFLLVLINYVGQGFPLIMDRYTGFQVWNHPIAGYTLSEITPEDDLGPHPQARDVHRVRMSATVWWLRNDVDSDHVTESFEFSDGPSYESRELVFEVWLDGPLRFEGGRLERSGDIILAREGDAVLGGSWLNSHLNLANSHPDYLWIPTAFARGDTRYRNPHLDAEWITDQF